MVPAKIEQIGNNGMNAQESLSLTSYSNTKRSKSLAKFIGPE